MILIVMYITDVLTKTKAGKISHRCTLLREAYREDGKNKNRTIANLTHCDPKEVEALRLALKYKHDLTELASLKDVALRQGTSIGAVWLITRIAQKVGIEYALGTDRQGKLALWQICARIIDQGSRLSAVRLASTHAACDILAITETFTEDHLYKNLTWLADNQKTIEDRLFHTRTKPELFLYDVTSSYLEGDRNTFAEWGYNRDKKSGKKQIVAGLLCDEEGQPVSIELFKGNTRDPSTFESQVQKTTERFGCARVTFVGDRGMIKSGQIDTLKEAGFHYITAITKPEIETLLKNGIIQMELFEDNLCEVVHGDIRYILRRNPVRAQEMEEVRAQKKESILKLLSEKNIYLATHPGAHVDVALRDIEQKICRLRTEKWLTVLVHERTLSLIIITDALQEEAKFDGCYVIKSDLPEVDKTVIHRRYKDLAMVEQAFRTSKTDFLELRPWNVRTAESSRGHALVVMLAYMLIRYLKKVWASLDITVEEGIHTLSTLTSLEMVIEGKGSSHHIPVPQGINAQLLKTAGISLPKALPHSGVTVVSRKKLQDRRKLKK
jgi:transposase